jgi:hydrogenase maturation protease
MQLRVIGIGNVLLGDDALGPWLIHRLATRHFFPPGVELVEAGTPGFALTGLLEGADAVLVLDALQADLAPGTVLRVAGRELLEGTPLKAVGPHEPGLREALLALELEGRLPKDLTLLGAVPARLEGGVGLSPQVREALPVLERLVLEELAARAVRVEPRESAEPCLPWWERGSALEPKHE